MQRSLTHDRRRLRTLSVLVPLAVLLIATFAATPAIATPSQPTLTLARLTEMLAASPSGTVPGSFKTVMKGSTVDDIACTIVGIVPNATEDGGDLIMIQVTDSGVLAAGGIAAGMSGSPVYVDDSGLKIAGAVSYGEYFTTGGLGLATPIENMMALETDFPTAGATVTLSSPMHTSSGDVSKIAFAGGANTTKPAEGTVAMRPLSALSVTGLPKDSTAYRELVKRMTAAGIDIADGLAAAPSGQADAFTTPFVPGAAVGALATRGALTYGGIGTVTYTTADNRLAAFGHPFGPVAWGGEGPGDGNSQYYLCNADVIGVWSSSESPFKVAAPGAVRGTVYRDSGAGILGAVGSAPAETAFTSTATNAVTGVTKTASTWAPQWIAGQPLNTYMMATLTFPAQYKATGDGVYGGSMAYRLDVKVSDGTNDYTIHRDSVWDSTVDAPFMATLEQMNIYDKLLADPYGIAPCTIKSVDINATMSPQHPRAGIASLSVPGGLHVGVNTVHVTLWPYGKNESRELDVPLTLPKGTNVEQGTLYAAAPDTGVADEGNGWFSLWDPVDGWSWDTTVPRRTLAELVTALNAVPDSRSLQIAYDNGEGEWTSERRPWSRSAVTTSAATGSYLTGNTSRRTSTLKLRTMGSRAVAYGAPLPLTGMVTPLSESADVSIYARSAGGKDRLLAVVPAEAEGGSGGETSAPAVFAYMARGLRHTSTLRAQWDGDSTVLGATGTRKVVVSARTKLTVSAAGGGVRLVARVLPHDAGGSVVFERQVGKKTWRIVARDRLSKKGVATANWNAAAGSYTLRARFTGSKMNGADPSAPKTFSAR